MDFAAVFFVAMAHFYRAGAGPATPNRIASLWVSGRLLERPPVVALANRPADDLGVDCRQEGWA